MVILLKWQKAWLAAAIDGEGCIFWKTHSGNGRRGQCVNIANTNKSFVDFARSLSGVGVVVQKKFTKKKPTYKDMYIWWVYSKNAMWLLSQIADLLVIKREKANKMLSGVQW